MEHLLQASIDLLLTPSNNPHFMYTEQTLLPKHVDSLFYINCVACSTYVIYASSNQVAYW